jgi:hypothetical protein
MAGGRPDPIDPYYLYFYRSLRFCGGDCFNYLETPQEVQMRIEAVFDGYRKGFLGSDISDIVPLEQASALHAKIESRATSGNFCFKWHREIIPSGSILFHGQFRPTVLMLSA